MPRFVIFVKATTTSEGKGTPAPKTLEAVGAFNEELNAAGVLLAGEGLRPTSEGYRVRFSATDADVDVTKGPFDIKKEGTVSGWWILRTKDLDEALAWAKKIPFRGTQNAEVEVRRISEAEDFGDAFTEELRAKEEKLRAELENKQGL